MFKCRKFLKHVYDYVILRYFIRGLQCSPLEPASDGLVLRTNSATPVVIFEERNLN